MTTDARNSIYLWAGGLAVFGLFWAGLHFHVLDWVPDWLLWPLVGIAAVGNLAQTLWGFWKHRASNSDDSSRC